MSSRATKDETQGINTADSVGERAPAEDGSPRSSTSNSGGRARLAQSPEMEQSPGYPGPEHGPGDVKRSKPLRKRALDPSYKKLFNETLQETTNFAARSTSKLSTSFIGASLWSREEKDSFFHSLSRHGLDNLPALSRLIPTKNELQIREYLLALQEGASIREIVSSDHVPLSQAAFDIPLRSQRLFDAAADVLAQRTYRDEIAEERKKFASDFWIINDDSIEQLNEGNNPPDDDFWNPEISPSLQFLLPEAFLQLSRSLFMNGPPDTQANWQDMDLLDPSEELSTPAIFHSAFNELYQITLDLTRRLVSAALFQTTSRLRAKDDRQPPKAEVTVADVDTACDILRVERNGRKYWAHVARRCGIDVYTNSNKVLKDGRESTKNGVQLSYDEVETALGFPRIVDAREKNEQVSTVKAVHSAGLSEEEDEPRPTAPHDSDHSLADPDSDHPSSTPSFPSLPHSSDDDIDTDTHLEILDQRANQAEDDRILEWLRRDPDPTVKRLDSEEEDEEPFRPNFRQRPKRPGESDNDVSWRKRRRYEAEWERFASSITLTRDNCEHGDSANSPNGPARA